MYFCLWGARRSPSPSDVIMSLDLLRLSNIPIFRGGTVESFCEKFLWSKPTSFSRPRVCQHFRLTTALVSDKKNRQTSTSNGSETGPRQIASDSEFVDLWSSLSTFVHTDNGDLNAMNTSETMLGLSAALFDGVNSFDMEDEEPARYVPPSPIDATDLEMNMKAEDALYILKDVLSGPMKKVGMKDKCAAAWRIVNADVKVKDPLFCMKGKKRLQDWLKTLADAGTIVDLHEIYVESLTLYPINRWVHAVWTLSLTQDLPKSLTEAGLWDWWTLNCDALLRETHCWSQINPSGSTLVKKDGSNMTTSSKDFVPSFHVGSSPSTKRTVPLQLKLSGESKFELDNSGQVLSIESAWYITKDEGMDMLDLAKLWLSALLNKEASD